ncbi:hypothetical protein Lche_2684 [Legionella cherrii]|uniref:Uncharacterized protein n=1 Tax=Legionella cherrii TaxID=28084 RepID=A0A0W0SB48_9GAMM|nr:hypothetical protein Lche_2684 [Legionella cherrii]
MLMDASLAKDPTMTQQPKMHGVERKLNQFSFFKPALALGLTAAAVVAATALSKASTTP